MEGMLGLSRCQNSSEFWANVLWMSCLRMSISDMKLVYQCHTETVGTLLFQSWPIAHVSFSPQYIHLHYSDMSLWRGLNWDADLSNTHESVSSPGPPMTKAFLQSFMPGSSLETHVSQEILWDLLQIEFWWPSLSLPKITDIYKSYNSSRYKWDSSWGPF